MHTHVRQFVLAAGLAFSLPAFASAQAAGVVLVKATGTGACLLGKTWRYDSNALGGNPYAAKAK